MIKTPQNFGSSSIKLKKKKNAKAKQNKKQRHNFGFSFPLRWLDVCVFGEPINVNFRLFL